jgi:hypothetical protein
VLIIRRINCINTTSGICHSLSVTISCAGRKVPYIPDIYQTYTRGCIDTIDSPDDEHGVARNMYRIEINTQKKNCASSWSFTKNHNEMHGQQNIN